MVRTIPICSALALLLMPVAAEARQNEPSAIGLYVRARIADNVNLSTQAVANYAAALTADPDSMTIAFRAYREAVEAGDYALALRSVQAMERAGSVPPDAHLLLYVAALRNRDWAAAKTKLNDVAREPGFGFLAPLFGRWLESATHAPVRVEGAKVIDQRPNAYTTENEALLMLANGNLDDGVLAVKALWTLDPYRAGSLRLAAASRVAERGERARALSLIVADDQAAANGRAQIGAGKKTGLSVTSPADGTAFLLARIAGDLIVEGGGRSALTMARMASFAAPKNARIQLMVAGALAARKKHAAALAIAESVATDPIYNDDAASLRIDQLEALGRIDDALAGAVDRANRSPNDAARIGDIELRRGNFAAATTAYRKAVDALGDKAAWPLIYAAGNAADAAGDWAVARPLLERALKMAPDEPAILNELGYGLVLRSEDMARGSALVARAADLRPDDAAIVDSLGWATFRKGDVEQAIPLLERAARLDNGQAEIGEHLGDAYWQAGQRIAARYAWAAARVQALGAQALRLDGKIADGPGKP